MSLNLMHALLLISQVPYDIILLCTSLNRLFRVILLIMACLPYQYICCGAKW